MPVLTATTLASARRHIAATDAVMARLIERLPPPQLARREPPFHTLAVSIINQQLSQKAAAAIERRITALVAAPLDAARLTALPPTALRAAGLSRSKVDYLHALAEAERSGALTAAHLRRLSDEEVVTTLTAIRGVGKWTAEMFLMFGLRRPDVLSLGDAGLLRAARLLYGKRLRGDDAAVLTKAAEKWRPWRTVGCAYLWRALDEPAWRSKAGGKKP